MAIVTGLTANRMLDIENASVVSGAVVGDNLHLSTRGGSVIDAGSVRGPQGNIGDDGPTGPQGPPGLLGGTTAQRDTYFGTPTTDPARVALANQKVTWYNTDFGWIESFYAVTGLSGLTALGLITGTASGWYPMSEGPWAIINGTSQTITDGVVYSNYNAFGTSRSFRRGGSAWFTLTNSNQRLTYAVAGYYDIQARYSFPNGSGTPVTSMRVKNAAGSDLEAFQTATPLLSAYGQQVMYEAGIVAVTAGGYSQIQMDTGSISTSPAYHKAVYKGPLLVNS